MLLTALPPEIIISIFLHLSVRDFSSLTQTCHRLHSFHDEHQFWRRRVQADFRLPPQPLFEADGARWRWLYRNMRTRSAVYTWGNDEHGNLGQSRELADQVGLGADMRRAGFPRPMDGLRIARRGGTGQVVDVQCGGWSTVLLESSGKLFAAGVVDGERVQWQSRRGPESSVVAVTMPLKPDRRWLLDISSRSVAQFSMGRKRLLALSDEGEVIEWTLNFTVAGDLLSADQLRSDMDYAKEPRASQIVAGWGHSSALYPGLGLYYWTTVGIPDSEDRTRRNSILACDPRGTVRVVPGTRSSTNEEPVKGSLQERIGRIQKYLVLEHHILILSEAGKLFSWRMPHTQLGSQDDLAYFDAFEPTEVTTFYSTKERVRILDLQGSFRSFGVFHSDGAILTGALSDDNGPALPNTRRTLSANNVAQGPGLPTLLEPTRPVSLQSSGVLQLAFGDYHMHALHADGSVSSHGRESQSCGALGFGSEPLSRLRGLRQNRIGRAWRPDAELELPLAAAASGGSLRRVWFEPEKFDFLCAMHNRLVMEANGAPNGVPIHRPSRLARTLVRDPARFAHVCGEWFEQAGRDWATGPSWFFGQDDAGGGRLSGSNEAAKEEKMSDNDGGGGTTSISTSISSRQIAPYFAIKIAAAGWSSAAVVLVDEERAEVVRQKYLLRPLPRPTPASGHGREGKEDETENEEGRSDGAGSTPATDAASAAAPDQPGSWADRIKAATNGINLASLSGAVGRLISATSSSSSSSSSSSAGTPERYIWDEWAFPQPELAPDGYGNNDEDEVDDEGQAQAQAQAQGDDFATLGSARRISTWKFGRPAWLTLT